MPSKTVLGESETSQRLPRNKRKADAGVQTLKAQGTGKRGEDIKGIQSLKAQGTGKMGEDIKGIQTLKAQGTGKRGEDIRGAILESGPGGCWGWGLAGRGHLFASCARWAAPLQPGAPAGTQESDLPNTRPIHVLRAH